MLAKGCEGGCSRRGEHNSDNDFCLSPRTIQLQVDLTGVTFLQEGVHVMIDSMLLRRMLRYYFRITE